MFQKPEGIFRKGWGQGYKAIAVSLHSGHVPLDSDSVCWKWKWPLALPLLIYADFHQLPDNKGRRRGCLRDRGCGLWNTELPQVHWKVSPCYSKASLLEGLYNATQVGDDTTLQNMISGVVMHTSLKFHLDGGWERKTANQSLAWAI